MSIEKYEDRIREFINSGRKQSTLLSDTPKWNKLCSSLDLIGDTQLAIESYPQFHDFKDYGAIYLVLYGILQTLLLQQDAAKHIGDALGIKVKRPKELEKIRVIRNSAAGHPGHQKENGLSKSSFITRTSISPVSFQLMTVYSGDKDYEFSTITIPPLLKIQEQYLSVILKKVVSELERQELEHRKMHNENKLVDIFPKTLRYHFSKIFEATSSDGMFSLGSINLNVISDCLENIKSGLSSRGEWGVYEAIDYHYDLIDYPLYRLKAFFNGEDDIDEKDAFIYASFLSDQMDSPKEIIIEIDEKYDSKP